MRKYLFLLMLLTNTCLAQRYDNAWLMGYNNKGWNDSSFNIIHFNFAKAPFPKVETNFNARFRFFENQTGISDEDGNVLAYFDGYSVLNKNIEIMENGDSLNYLMNETANQKYVPQNSIMLPYPNHKGQFVLIHGQVDFWNPSTKELNVSTFRINYSIFDLNKNNDDGKVITRKKLLLSDTLEYGKIAAVRHGNGRDWWIIAQEFRKPNYYIYALTPAGILLKAKQIIGDDKETNTGQAFFTPDGTKYINLDILLSDKTDARIFNFDRCSGILSAHKVIKMNFKGTLCVGAAIAPNSRFLYVTTGLYLLQFDLLAADIEASMEVIGEYDGFKDKVFGLETYFYNAELAPNSKIYITTPNATPFLHVINEPNLKGDSCNFVQHGVALSCYSTGLPNMPNYNIGLMKGSPCDTIHSIATEEIVLPKDEVKIFPNPANEEVNIQSNSTAKLTLLVKDVNGKLLHSEDFTEFTVMSSKNMANGLYFYEIWNGNHKVTVQKLAIIH